jgi:glycosyltransferase involved in cell wall biosynthesis
MRVLHVGKFFPPHPGGIERCTAELCAGLAQRKLTVAALAHAEPGARGTELRAEGGYEVTLAACHGRVLYAPLSPGFPLALARIIRRFRPDLLHLHVPNTSAFAALWLPAARRLPWIVHWHADIPVDSRRRLLPLAYRLYRPWEQALLRRAAAVIATSAPYRDSSSALAPWRGKTHVIPLGIAPRDGRVDGAPTAMPPAECKGLRVLAVGRLSYFKGIDVLLHAITLVPEASLTVIGDGECRASLERLARDLHIEPRVTFAGRIDMDAAGEARLARAYRAADVLCLPSIDRAESFGLVLLEAMQARLPVIASAIAGSGVGYVVCDGETGLLVRPGDVDALVAALVRLGADPALRARLGSAGEQRWRDEFTLDRAADRVMALYDSVLRKAPVRASAAPAG